MKSNEVDKLEAVSAVIEYYDATLMPLIRRTGAVMVSIDYQLSPEAHYKTALMECERVVHAIHNKKCALSLSICLPLALSRSLPLPITLDVRRILSGNPVLTS